MASIDSQLNLLIDGKLVRGDSTFDVVNPATGKVFAQSGGASEAQTNAAVEAAAKAQPAWAALSLDERRSTMAAAKAVLEQQTPILAALLVKEQGKPLDQAEGEIGGCGSVVLAQCSTMEIPEDVYSETEDRKIVVVRRPIGVVACISPWNYPLFTSVQKWAPALVLGNTVIVKPSPFTPLSTLALAAALKAYRNPLSTWPWELY